MAPKNIYDIEESIMRSMQLKTLLVTGNKEFTIDGLIYTHVQAHTHTHTHTQTHLSLLVRFQS